MPTREKKTEEEERTFWASRDSTEFVDWRSAMASEVYKTATNAANAHPPNVRFNPSAILTFGLHPNSRRAFSQLHGHNGRIDFTR